MRSQFFTLDTPDSLDLLLLIQNEGKGLVRVAISVPDFVQLEKKEKKMEVRHRRMYSKIRDRDVGRWENVEKDNE